MYSVSIYTIDDGLRKHLPRGELILGEFPILLRKGCIDLTISPGLPDLVHRSKLIPLFKTGVVHPRC